MFQDKCNRDCNRNRIDYIVILLIRNRNRACCK